MNNTLPVQHTFHLEFAESHALKIDPLDHAEVDVLLPQFPMEQQEQSMAGSPDSRSSSGLQEAKP